MRWHRSIGSIHGPQLLEAARTCATASGVRWHMSTQFVEREIGAGGSRRLCLGTVLSTYLLYLSANDIRTYEAWRTIHFL